MMTWAPRTERLSQIHGTGDLYREVELRALTTKLRRRRFPRRHRLATLLHRIADRIGR